MVQLERRPGRLRLRARNGLGLATGLEGRRAMCRGCWRTLKLVDPPAIETACKGPPHVGASGHRSDDAPHSSRLLEPRPRMFFPRGRRLCRARGFRFLLTQRARPRVRGPHRASGRRWCRWGTRRGDGRRIEDGEPRGWRRRRRIVGRGWVHRSLRDCRLFPSRSIPPTTARSTITSLSAHRRGSGASLSRRRSRTQSSLGTSSSS